ATGAQGPSELPQPTLPPVPRVRRALPRLRGEPPPPASPGSPPTARGPLPRLRRVLPRLRGAPSPGFAGYSPDCAGTPSPGFAGYSPDCAGERRLDAAIGRVGGLAGRGGSVKAGGVGAIQAVGATRPLAGPLPHGGWGRSRRAP